ncbi:MAG: aldo/keto reductase [Malacoplasma sp.]|nr:aldo/keto reductase [Malacoplasma sp.]
METKIIKKRIAYGTYKIKDQSVLKQCLKQVQICGYDFIDTAAYYENEDLIGNAINELKNEGFEFKLPIQTKIWPTMFDRVFEAVHTSLQKLQVKQLDMCLLHWPHEIIIKNIIAWKTLIECQKKGLIKEIGVSNFSGELIKALSEITGVTPFANQIELSVDRSQDQLVEFNKTHNIETQAWRPLKNLDTLKYNPVVMQIAKKYNVEAASILIAYVSNLNHTVLVKSENLDRIKQNYQAFFIKLESDEVAALKKLATRID